MRSVSAAWTFAPGTVASSALKSCCAMRARDHVDRVWRFTLADLEARL